MQPFLTKGLPAGTRVLVTGGAGFIGSHLAEALLYLGCRVSVIDDLSTGRFENIRHLEDHPDFSFALDSVTHEAVLDHLVRDCDVVFHLAAAVGVDLVVRDPVHALESNLLGTHAVLQAVNRYRKSLFFTSTSEVYGKGEIPGFAEDDDCVTGPTTKARWSYAAAKAACEHLCLAYHRQKRIPVIVVRLFNTVGPRQRGRYGMVIPRFVAQAIADEPLTVYSDGAQSRCFCDVDDAVRGMLAIAQHPRAAGQVFNVGSNREIRILDLAHKVLEIAGVAPEKRDARIRFVPYEEAFGPGFEDMRRRVPALDRIRELTGWEPRISLEEILERVFASMGCDQRPSASAQRPSASAQRPPASAQRPPASTVS